MEMETCIYVLFITLLCNEPSEGDESGERQIRFGQGRPSHKVNEIEGFPSPLEFINNYVQPMKPIKMRGALVGSKAFSTWTDDYFLSLDIPADNLVQVETIKKEDRNQDILEVHFKDFVRTYNKTDQYMVQPVPPFLGKDLPVPYPLQCPIIMDMGMVESLIWFSSGGTSSVVHTDSVDNINCVYSGDKEFVLVDPALYGDKVDIDHPEGSYSGVDVDDVDYAKYPGLREVEFELVNLTAGDCLYIPYKWIHQVRSYGRNIAVNIFWDSEVLVDHGGVDDCNTEADETLTLDTLEFSGLDGARNSVKEIKALIGETLHIKPLDFTSFLKAMNTQHGVDIEAIDPGRGYAVPLREAFNIIDTNQNSWVEFEDCSLLTDEDWEDISELVDEFENNVFLLADMLTNRRPKVSRDGHDGDEL